MRVTKRQLGTIVTHILISMFGLIMAYPLVWLVFSSLKPSNEVLTTINLIPSKFIWSNFRDGWSMVRPYSFSLFFLNSFKLVFACVIGSSMVSLVVGYGFSRFEFKIKKIFLVILFITIMLPSTTTLVSKYVIFAQLNWLNTYLPFIVTSCLGVGVGGGFFIYLMIQFIRGIPKELDEAAIIDGCSSFKVLRCIITPLSKSAIFSVAIFAFMWNWDDFQNQLIYLSNVSGFTVPLALRSTIDVSGAENWGAVMAISLCSLLPAIILFFSLQKYFVEGIATSGIKV